MAKTAGVHNTHEKQNHPRIYGNTASSTNPLAEVLFQTHCCRHYHTNQKMKHAHAKQRYSRQLQNGASGGVGRQWQRETKSATHGIAKDRVTDPGTNHGEDYEARLKSEAEIRPFKVKSKKIHTYAHAL